MKRARATGSFLAVSALFVLACRDLAETSGPAPDTRAADEAAIRAADAGWLEAVRAKDLDRTVSFYAEEALVFPVAGLIVSGREAIRSEWSHLFAIPGFDNTSRIEKIEVARSGDLAYAHGTYATSMKEVGGGTATERGKWVVVWKKQTDGPWRIAAEIYNTDSPPPVHEQGGPESLPGGAAHGGGARGGEVKMENVGKTYLFDYGDLVLRVRYLSDRRLAWEQIKGPEAGLRGEEEYESATIRPGVLFVWWQEKDTSVVAQVVDFDQGRIHTTWVSPDRKVASFQGTVARTSDDRGGR